jgi:drug/metabolite transporter (DMT)-like permease
MSQHRGRAAAFSALTLLALVWGYNWVVMKIALRYAAPFQFTALRALGAAAVLFAFLAAARRPLRSPAPARMLLLALFQTVGFVSLTSFALATGNAGKTAILAYTMPFWVLILAVPLLGERITHGKAIAGGLGFAGLLLILSPWTSHPNFTSTLLAAGAGLDWALAVMVAKKIPAHGTWELLALNAWQTLAGCIPLAVAAILVPAPAIRWTPAFDLALAYNVVLGTSLAWFLWLFVLSRLPAGLSGLSALIIPIVGIVAAWIQLGERPGPWEGAGIATIVAGLATLAWAEGRGGAPTEAG